MLGDEKSRPASRGRMKAKRRCPDSEGGSASFAADRAGPGLEDFPKCPLAAMGSAPSRSLLLSLLSLLPAVCGELLCAALLCAARFGAELLLNAFFFSYR